MDTKLHFENLILLIHSFLIFIFLLFGYGLYQANSNDPTPAGCGVVIDSNFSKIKESPDLNLGMTLFKYNCASCHAKNMKAKMTGPALAGVEKRWNGNLDNLRAWIRNSQAYLETDDDYAKKLYAEYGGSVMTAFPNLTDEEIDAILSYIDAVSNPGGLY